MINLQTKSDELWRVLPEEHDKAIYWLKKHFGGEERYEKMRDDLLIRCRRAGWPMASEVVDYTSKRGNRWVCFEQATYYPECHGSHCMLSGKQSQDSQELRKFGDFMRVVRGLTVFNNCKTVKL